MSISLPSSSSISIRAALISWLSLLFCQLRYGFVSSLSITLYRAKFNNNTDGESWHAFNTKYLTFIPFHQHSTTGTSKCHLNQPYQFLWYATTLQCFQQPTPLLYCHACLKLTNSMCKSMLCSRHFS